ncbi:unnamed protein product, partial [marine sediment metagenome]
VLLSFVFLIELGVAPSNPGLSLSKTCFGVFLTVEKVKKYERNKEIAAAFDRG